MSSVYAPFFAASCAKKDEKWVVIEIDGDVLDKDRLVPDEDFLEQSTRKLKIDGCRARTMKGRTKWFKENVLNYSTLWDKSLEYMGVVGYRDTVNVSAIKGYSVFDPRSNLFIASMCMDPMISIINYRLCSDKYRELTNWFFKRNVNVATFIYGFNMNVNENEANELVRMFELQLKLLEKTDGLNIKNLPTISSAG